eukprot:6019439-Prorocentrum_lima.AAC.1
MLSSIVPASTACTVPVPAILVAGGDGVTCDNATCWMCQPPIVGIEWIDTLVLEGCHSAASEIVL